MYVLYGGPFTRALIVEMVLAEGDLAYELRAIGSTLDRLGVIDRRLGHSGPYHLGERFSLVDITLAYWAVYLAPASALESRRLPAT